MANKMKERIFRWISKTIFRQKDGFIYNQPTIILRWIMFPLDTYLDVNTRGYDWRSNTWVIYDQEYSLNFLESLSKLPEGEQITLRRVDGELIISANEWYKTEEIPCPPRKKILGVWLLTVDGTKQPNIHEVTFDDTTEDGSLWVFPDGAFTTVPPVLWTYSNLPEIHPK